jgi:hypothetical protein
LREFLDATSSREWPSCIAVIIEPEGRKFSLVPGPVVLVAWDQTYPELGESRKYVLDQLDARLHALLAPDLDTVKRRARQNFDKLTEPQRAMLAGLDATAETDIWRVPAAEFPACLRLMVEISPALEDQALRALARSKAFHLRGPIEG